jgi:hypothetical protein
VTLDTRRGAAVRVGSPGAYDNRTMTSRANWWRTIRWPLLLLGVAVLGIVVAAVLDRTAAREWALTIGAPSLTILLPASLLWLVISIIYVLLRRRDPS